MIPKTIHYCWFGKKPIPPDLMRNIESWKKFLPDYKITRWDESNFDVHCNKYVEKAYREKKYAYVSDYARFAILKKNGGIYFDTDVEVIRPIDDILAAGPYMGEESPGKVATGLGMAMEPEMPFLREMEELYNKLEFRIFEDQKTVTVVDRVTNLLARHGFDSRNRAIQNVCGINIYPVDYFCPQNFFSGKMTITNNTRTIHHYAESWKPPIERFLHQHFIAMERKYGQTKYTLFLESQLWRYRKMQKRGIVNTLINGFAKRTSVFKKHKNMLPDSERCRDCHCKKKGKE